MARFSNPFAFTPLPVIILTTVTYVALFSGLLTTHLTVPAHPSKTPSGTNLTQAWIDLETITRYHHPYNSHANDDVRKYLLSRVKQHVTSKNLTDHQVQIIDDNVSNVTFSEGSTTVYFEGTNIIVAIRGSEDGESFYSANRAPENGGVLVNAHYDSVSTGYGATDDGVGVVSVLQLLSYFTEEGNWPKRTVVLLLNNGEEDFLNGAKAFMRHPISQVPHTFLNLEGAGAGGRATLFRSTDTEVTSFYKAASRPFGTVASSDGFKKHLIRSETDYVVFNGELGLRGLDVAFMEPRARYHTIEDSTKETSLDSVWHMLSASIATTAGLADDTSTTFSGTGQPRSDGTVDAGTGSEAVWFDMFGRVFVIFRLHTLFALCVTLLVVAPITLIGLTVGLSKADKNFLFARKQYVHSPDDDEPIQLNGWRGFFRFPITFGVSTAITVALAFLFQRVNPHIVYSSPFAVWASMFSAWCFSAWFLLRGASAMRPSALQRMYALIWVFIGSFALLIFTTILVQNFQVAGGYFALFYFASVFFALVLSYIELFCAPKKSAYVALCDQEDSQAQHADASSRPLTGSTSGPRSGDRSPLMDDDATETTSLLRGDRRSFRRYDGRRQSTSEGTDSGERSADLGHAYPGEQKWSGKLPNWLWIVQFLAIAPINIVLVGQLALLTTSGLYQTPADGSPTLFIYLAFAVLTTLLAVPLGPFIHRFTYHVPTFLFFVCVGTVIYNLIAFPFSREHRLKVYFQQQVDLESGMNTVSLTGLDGYVQDIINELPSAQGQEIDCRSPHKKSRAELKKCAWQGLPVHVAPTLIPFGNKTTPDSWLDYSITRNKSANEASIRLVGQNTRACRIMFDTPATNLVVGGAVSDDPRFNATTGKTSEIRLWHRTWSTPFTVNFTWDGDAKSSGRVVCLWSDANANDVPAFNEVQHYIPNWAVATKYSDGLVDISRAFVV
ncbi:unnamed protein product [Periconia digitata]|uniref:Peptide hydrolase n=1 Tax=Periconia digitata TaxID=1303443 RepID=A0A9W4U9T4_9PLEO|nr:unnamed protein product [Periconia digitata]